MEQEQYHLTKGKTTGDAVVFIYKDAIDRIENYIKGFYKWIKKDDNADVHIKLEDFEEVDKLIRKYLYTYQKNQPKTKEFLERIFKKYENGDVKISLAALRVIEFMDDELLGAIVEKWQSPEKVKINLSYGERSSYTPTYNDNDPFQKHNLIIVHRGYKNSWHFTPSPIIGELHKLITEK